MLGIAPI